jgi:uncharacterized protein YjlB
MTGCQPVTFYRRAMKAEGADVAGRFEPLFAENGWPPDWRDGVFDYHHYHSTAHEVLGVFAGAATLELGGADGRQVEMAAGNALMLPAGTGHRCVMASADFCVVGAYPQGQAWDICREAPDEGARARIASLPDPRRDPITAETGGRTGT